MNSILLLIFGGCLLASAGVSAQAILIEDPQSNRPTKTRVLKTLESPPMQSIEKRTLRQISSERDYISLFELKSHRRMGIGAELMGRLGMVGITFDFNFSGNHAATAGVGAGPQYYSYSLGYKRTLNDTSLAPYTGLSLTRIQLREERVLQKMLMAPQLGLQYTQFYGPSAGATMFMEVLFLYDFEARKTAPAAAFGMMYYL